MAAFPAVFPRQEALAHGNLARVGTKEIDLRSEPNDEAPIIGKRYRDQLVHIYDEDIPPDAPAFYNRLWYRVWGGYLHSAHLQKVQIKLNEPLAYAPESGWLFEVSVPYTVAYQWDKWNEAWKPWRGSKLYDGSTHWVTGVTGGPDGELWYEITNELSSTERYLAPGKHLRHVRPEEITPLSPHVPAENKRIEVSLNRQMVIAYEFDEVVYEARISSGIPNPRLDKSELQTATPEGRHRIYSKMPSKHMGSVAGGAQVEEDGGFSLPGVPWTGFFRFPGGYAFHGTYWHNNFGLQMSHGCVNMRNEDAKWLFRWTTPVFDSLEIESSRDWEKTGHGTTVVVNK